MSTSVRRNTQHTRRPQLWGRLTIAFAAAAATTLTGLPALEQAEAAKPPNVKPVRCDEKFLGRQFPSTPANSGPPDGLPYDAWPNDENYTYDNPAKAYDGVLPPTDAQRAAAGKDYRTWQRQYNKSKNPADKVMEIYARYNSQYDSRTGYQDFRRFLDVRYIGAHGNPPRGAAFEARMVKKYNMVGPDWWCQDTIEYTDPETGEKRYRVIDAHHRPSERKVEMKSNGKIEDDQLRADRQIAKERPKSTFRYLTGAATEDTTKDKIKQFDDDLKRDRGTTRNQAGVNERRSNAIERTQKPTVYTNYDKRFNPDPLKGGRGPIIDQALRSGKTVEEARKLQAMYNRANSGGYFGRGPGGIDFSTLEINYVGTPVKGKGLDYSMKADYAKDPDKNPGYGGDAKLQLASDAFFTWLALTPDRFWVNLNPIRPDVIMDKEFAKTDAGRVLLEADLTLKHDYADAMNPDKYERGERFWQAAPRTPEGMPCLPVIRQWITPKPAKVREQDGGIYILDAPLKVNMEVPTGPDVPAGGCRLTEAQTRQAEALILSMIRPELERRVNEDASYADLRRVYSSRVAAEYVRRQDAVAPTDFRRIINSNDVSRWPLRGENKDWDKKTVYDKYVYSFKNGDYKFERVYGGKVWILSMGGVDFSKAPKRDITRAQFTTEYRGLDRTTRNSVQTEVTYRSGGTAYLGGSSAEQPTIPEDPKPTPTPTPSPSTPGDPTPSGTPSTPAPSTPGGDHATPPGRTPGGDLAHTGSSTPVGLIVGIAAALAVAGGGLLWWVRRRRSTEG
ncbi:LAETG motif-containing sortase-dependent surface protein [Streptomyces sp. NPDC048623]|uniref:LAETG motif-containing sortase-dependent surface protein n=1 Tax=Streptomyces sp. NPDC048623 TaxID=3155761 RepID=UPI00342E8D13